MIYKHSKHMRDFLGLFIFIVVYNPGQNCRDNSCFSPSPHYNVDFSRSPKSRSVHRSLACFNIVWGEGGCKKGSEKRKNVAHITMEACTVNSLLFAQNLTSVPKCFDPDCSFLYFGGVFKGELKARRSFFLCVLLLSKYNVLYPKNQEKSFFILKGLEFAQNPWLFFQFDRPPFGLLFFPVTSKKGMSAAML